MRNGYCQFWFEKQPEGRPGRSAEGVAVGCGVRTGCADDHDASCLSATEGSAIPIAPLQGREDESMRKSRYAVEQITEVLVMSISRQPPGPLGSTCVQSRPC